MADRPKMPVPRKELSPQQLVRVIQAWAESQGYGFSLLPHSNEHGRVVIRDAEGTQTITVVPNAHHGRRLLKHQIRYTIQGINANWEEPRDVT